MLGSEILLTAPQPRGVFLEGTLSDTNTIYPGAAMQVVSVSLPNASNFQGGQPLWQRYAPSADGDPRLCAILLPDWGQGQLFSTAYVNGARVFLYCPLAGEYMNILVPPQAGTGSANAYDVGMRLIPDHSVVSAGSYTNVGGGFITTATSSVMAWFMAMEHYDAPVDAPGWLWAQKQF